MENTIKILDDNNIEYNINVDKIYLQDCKLYLNNKNLQGILDVSVIENLKELRCTNNFLTNIICNKGLNVLNCTDNNISEIKCNDKLKTLYCYYNPIIKLNRNNIYTIVSDIYIHNNDFYLNKIKIKELKNHYLFKRFLYKETIEYTYRNYLNEQISDLKIYLSNVYK